MWRNTIFSLDKYNTSCQRGGEDIRLGSAISTTRPLNSGSGLSDKAGHIAPSNGIHYTGKKAIGKKAPVALLAVATIYQYIDMLTTYWPLNSES